MFFFVIYEDILYTKLQAVRASASAFSQELFFKWKFIIIVPQYDLYF